jgi:type II secretory pathway pseudopilin PulG
MVVVVVLLGVLVGMITPSLFYTTTYLDSSAARVAALAFDASANEYAAADPGGNPRNMVLLTDAQVEARRLMPTLVVSGIADLDADGFDDDGRVQFTRGMSSWCLTLGQTPTAAIGLAEGVCPS